jgi:predicted ribosomally synthesized peptide with nif11-like leader
MSADQVQAFLKKVTEASFRAAFEAAATAAAKRKVLDAAGLTLSVTEAEAALQGERELADEDLDKVAGGDAGVVRYPPPPTPPPTGG